MFFPGLLAAMATVVAVALAATGGFRRAADAAPWTRGGALRAGLAIAWVAVYVVAAEIVGFVLTAGVLLGGLMLCLRVRLLVAATTAVLVSAAVWQLFAVYLRVSLPWGWWGW
jgi:hypothetical protein